MLISIGKMAEARQLLHDMLDEIGLTTYRFHLEPEAGKWQLSIECAAHGRWQTVHLTLDAQTLEQARAQPRSRQKTLGLLRDSLAACDVNGAT